MHLLLTGRSGGGREIVKKYATNDCMNEHMRKHANSLSPSSTITTVRRILLFILYKMIAPCSIK